MRRRDDLAHPRRHQSLQIAVLTHPLVREELAEVVASRIGQQDHHDVLRSAAHGRLDRRVQSESSGAADEDALLAREPPRRDERLAVGDLDDLVHDGAVERPRPEILTHALDLVRSDGAAVDRALGVGTDDAHGCVLLLEKTSHTADRPAGADAGDEDGYTAVGLVPDLRSGGAVMRFGVAGIEILIGLKRTGNLARQPIRDRVVRLRRLSFDVGGADHHFRAVRPQQADLLRRHLVRHDKNHLVALEGSRHGEAMPGVARRGLDERAAGPQQPAPLGILDHGEPDPVLDAASWIELLELRKDGGAEALGDLVEAQQRGAADEVEDALHVLHRGTNSRRVGGGGRCAIRWTESARTRDRCSRASCGRLRSGARTFASTRAPSRAIRPGRPASRARRTAATPRAP